MVIIKNLDKLLSVVFVKIYLIIKITMDINVGVFQKHNDVSLHMDDVHGKHIMQLSVKVEEMVDGSNLDVRVDVIVAISH